jgi:hypothetical protein
MTRAGQTTILPRFQAKRASDVSMPNVRLLGVGLMICVGTALARLYSVILSSGPHPLRATEFIVATIAVPLGHFALAMIVAGDGLFRPVRGSQPWAGVSARPITAVPTASRPLFPQS